MSQPWLSVISPTVGRASLERLLKSVRCQAPATEVELLIVGDVHGKKWRPSLKPVPALCAKYDARYLEHDGGQHAWGHPQRTAGATQATGDWLWWLQDDDIALDGAVDLIRQTVQHRYSPHLFRIHTHWGHPVWQIMSFLEGNIDADCALIPRDPAKLGQWTLRYQGDFDFIRETCDKWSWCHRWVDAFIARARPALADDWTRGR